MSHYSESPVAFFHHFAGFSYDPKTQTPEQGRQECAERLAAAEAWASARGYRFEWSIDPDTDSTDFQCFDDGEPYQQWICQMVDPLGDGLPLQCLGAIDLGPDGSPSTEPYPRVIEAELALEQMPG